MITIMKGGQYLLKRKLRIKNKKRLKSDLETIENIVKTVGSQWENKHPVFCIIDNLMMNEGSKRVMNLTSSVSQEVNGIFQSIESLPDTRKSIAMNKVLEENYIVDFSKDYVITDVWNNGRLINTLAWINSGKINAVGDTNEWKFDCNHEISFIFPMCILYSMRGNHSIYAGVIRRRGIAFLKYVEDYSALYKSWHFDGTHFVNNKLKIKMSYFEGLSFEIGRFLKDNPWLFAGHPYEKMLTENGCLSE